MWAGAAAVEWRARAAVGRRVWAGAAAVEWWRELAAVGRRVWAAAAVEWRERVVGVEQTEWIVLAATVGGWWPVSICKISMFINNAYCIHTSITPSCLLN